MTAQSARRSWRRVALVCLTMAFAFASGACATERLLGAANDQDRAALFDEIWREFDLHYSFFTLKHVDWAAIGATYRPRAIAATSDQEFAFQVGKMLNELHDVHVSLTPTGVGYAMRYLSPSDTSAALFDPELSLARYVRSTHTTPRRQFRFGMISDSIGYVLLPSFVGSALATELDAALDAMPSATRLIIDVRNNRGGGVTNAREIAGRFADRARTYGYLRMRNGPRHDDFTDYIEERVEPTSSRTFRGEVVVLTNRRDFSSAEDFVMAMHVLPNVTIMGDTTAGASGGPLERELSNGWTYELSEWIEYTSDFRVFEEIGLAPDVVVKPAAGDAAAGFDRVLERAMGLAPRASLSAP